MENIDNIEVKLRGAKASLYTNFNHKEFNRLAEEIFGKYKTIFGIESLLESYQLKIEQEDSVLRWTRKSEYTEKKAEIDHERDTLYTNFIRLVRAHRTNFDPFLQDNAKHIYNLLQNYGDVIHKDYDGETNALRDITFQLRSEKYIEASQSLGLLPWIDKIEEVNKLFENHAKSVQEEIVEKPTTTLVRARRETDRALRKLINRVNALIELEPNEQTQALAKEFNSLVSHYNNIVNEHYGRLHAKIDISSAEIEDILPQPYTGKPVFVIPAINLYLKKQDETLKTIELVFTKDFTVAYKNNVERGTATLTVQGIGKYTGEIITTFNIE
jgi:hypothetical protein